MMEGLFFSFSFLSVVLLTHLLPPLVYTSLHQFLRRLLFYFFFCQSLLSQLHLSMQLVWLEMELNPVSLFAVLLSATDDPSI